MIDYLGKDYYCDSPIDGYFDEIKSSEVNKINDNN